MQIVKATNADIEQCVDILFASPLGQKYYPNREMLKAEFEKGMLTDEIYVNKSQIGGGV